MGTDPRLPRGQGDGGAVKGSFSEAAGLDSDVDAIDYRTGPEDVRTKKLSGLTKYASITRKRQSLLGGTLAAAGALLAFAGLLGVGSAAQTPSSIASASPTATATSTAAAATSAPPAAANRPAQVGPIVATFVVPVTTYTVQATDPDGDPLTYAWTLTNPCGTKTGETTPTYAWSHPDPPCPNEAVHPGAITVVVSDGHFTVTRQYLQGSAVGTGPLPADGGVVAITAPPSAIPTTTSRPTSTATAASSASATTGTGGGGPNAPLTGVGLLLGGIGGALVATGRRTSEAKEKDPCDEQRRRVAQARAELESARERQRRINELRAANDSAQAELRRAQSEHAAAHDDRTVSWGEDAETGRRVYTNTDQVARMRSADAGLKAATDAANAAKSAWDRAGNGDEVRDAGYAVEDGIRHLSNAEEALARCLELNAPPAPPPPPPAPPTPPTTGGTSTGGGTPTTPGPAGPVISTPPPTTGTTTRPRQPKQECPDGTERTRESHASFELFLVWAAKIEIDGAFQFSEDDVEEALDGYKKFKMIVDIAQAVEGLSGMPAAAAGGASQVEAALHVLTQGVKQASSAADVPNPIDPSDASQWGVEQALNKLIDRVNRLRGLGTWIMTCPKVRVEATCIRTETCTGGQWVLTRHEFKLEYGEQVGTDQTRFENADQTNPQRGANEARVRLRRYFESRNRPAMDRIKEMARACARS